MHTEDKVVIFFVLASGISYFLDLHMLCLLVGGELTELPLTGDCLLLLAPML